MRLPKFNRRIRKQRREAEAIMRDRPRRRKLGPIYGEPEEPPPWHDETGAVKIAEIRDLHGPR
jgi:hypothetical protein